MKEVFKYYYYRYSPRKQRELASMSEILDEAKAHYGGLKGVRWLDHRFRPMTRGDLIHYGDDDVKALTQHSAPLLSDEEKECILGEWLQLKLLSTSQRTVKPPQLYASLLISKPDTIKHVLVLVEIMTVFSPCTASCESRSFSAMNKIKTNLKTTMQQETLQDLMTVSSSSENIRL